MKKVNKVILCILIGTMVLVLVGCGKTPLTQMDLDAGKDQAKAVKECYEGRKIDFTKVPKDVIGYVMMSKQFTDTLLAVTGNEPCKSTNMFDVQIAEVESKNNALGKSIGVGGDVIKMGLGIYGAVEIVGSVADSSGIKVNGDGNNISTATDEAHIGGSSFSTDKSGTGNSESNIESTLTPDEDSHNTTTTPTDSNNSTNSTN